MTTALLVLLYFLPSLVASARHRRNQHAIMLLNLLAGWTVVGWIGALVWGVTDPDSDTEKPKKAVATWDRTAIYPRIHDVDPTNPRS
jgi:hypothetical protein